jgi:prevent-host-death family protein
MKVSMIKVTATILRKEFSYYLDLASAGEIIVILRNNKEVARLVAMPEQDWREKMKTKVEFLVETEELIQPIDDIWDD